MSGKGSAPRPYSVDRKTFEDNWELIFKKNKQSVTDSQVHDELSFGNQLSLGNLQDEYYDNSVDRDDNIV